MNTNLCAQISKQAFDTYFVFLRKALATGQISTTVVDPVPSFPQTLVVTRTPDHFVVELTGARRTSRPLAVVKRQLANTNLVFDQFRRPPGSTPLKDFAGSTNCGVSTMALITPAARGELKRRFPGILERFPTQLQAVGTEISTTISMTAETTSFSLDDVLLVNSLDGSVRAKYVRRLTAIRRDTRPDEYRAQLARLLDTTGGGSMVGAQLLSRGAAEIVIAAAQFANVFLMDKLHETSLGEFLDVHRDILCVALNARGLLAEVEIPWQVPSPEPNEKAIRPDLFVERQDGFWDVFDLKLPLLDRTDITTGARKRRRFVATIEDGIAQLAHYREFLEIPEHREYLERMHGIRLRDPEYVLVVGNYENVDADKIAEAKRRLGRFELIDYDTILQLYVVAHGIIPGSTPASSG